MRGLKKWRPMGPGWSAAGEGAATAIYCSERASRERASERGSEARTLFMPKDATYTKRDLQHAIRHLRYV
jgi:hypothetical protein